MKIRKATVAGIPAMMEFLIMDGKSKDCSVIPINGVRTIPVKNKSKKNIASGLSHSKRAYRIILMGQALFLLIK